MKWFKGLTISACVLSGVLVVSCKKPTGPVEEGAGGAAASTEQGVALTGLKKLGIHTIPPLIGRGAIAHRSEPSVRAPSWHAATTNLILT